jgi:MoxR-like ATPase
MKRKNLDPTDLDSWAAVSPSQISTWLTQKDKDDGDLLQIAKPCNERLSDLAKAVKSRFLGRDEVIDALIDSMIAQVPVVVLGPPGTAKSRMVREIAKACGLKSRAGGERTDEDDVMFRSGESGGSYFEYLLSQHTMPEELFGAPSLEHLKQGQFRREFQGMLPVAEIAFLDEIFRGGSHILNTLLALLNERIFHDGKYVHKSPLIGIVAAANYAPRGEEAAALYDRFPIRVWIDSVLDDAAGMQEQALASAGKLVEASSKLDRTVSTDDSGARLACVNDFRLARSASLAWHRTHNKAKQREPFLKLFLSLRDPIGLSDRSLWQIMRVAAAGQWRRKQQFRIDHLAVFRFVAGTSDQRETVESEVRRIVLGTSEHGHA